MPSEDIVNTHDTFMKSFGIELSDDDKRLPDRYMCLKTYAEFNFYIKPQLHVSDENFLYRYMHLASKISSYGV